MTYLFIKHIYLYWIGIIAVQLFELKGQVQKYLLHRASLVNLDQQNYDHPAPWELKAWTEQKNDQNHRKVYTVMVPCYFDHCNFYFCFL